MRRDGSRPTLVSNPKEEVSYGDRHEEAAGHRHKEAAGHRHRKPPAKMKVEKGTLDYLELALENLNKAREHAQKDARGQIDTIVERVRGTIGDVRAELRSRAAHGR